MSSREGVRAAFAEHLLTRGSVGRDDDERDGEELKSTCLHVDERMIRERESEVLFVSLLSPVD